MNAPSVDIKNILIDNDSSGTFYVFGTTLFVSFEPDTPDRCITILDTGGFDPDVAATYERPTIQVRSRDKASQYQRAYDTIKDIADTLHGSRYTTNSTTYVIWQQGDIFYLGRDDNNRVLLTANFRIHRHP